MKLPGFILKLQEDLNKIPEAIRRRVNSPGGLSESELTSLLLSPVDHTLSAPQPPDDGKVAFYHGCFEDYSQIGTQAIHSKSVAYCILAGGLGTRVGEPKALLRVPELGMSLLTLKLFQAVGEGPIWIIVAPSLRDQVESHIRSQIGFDQNRISFIEQHESYRLTPDNQIVMSNNVPELYPCGTGDVFSILRDRVEAANTAGVKHVVVVNVDNVFAALEPAIVGHHISHLSKVTCEVVRRKENEMGSVLVNSERGRHISDQARMSCDITDYSWLSTGSYVIDLGIDFSPLGKTWYRRQKVHLNKVSVQYERRIDEITSFVDTSYLGVVRNERYMPILTPQDFELVRGIVKFQLD